MTDDRALIYRELAALHVRGPADIAVAAAREVLRGGKDLDDTVYACGAILIDCGGEIDDSLAISEGILIFQRFVDQLEDSDPRECASVRYNLANGYGALAKHYERSGDLDARLAAWQHERDELQTILLNPDQVPKELLPDTFTNFANSLSQLGRKTEALDYHDRALKLSPKHPIALGSAGQVTLDLLGIQPSHNLRLLFHAKQLLSSAVADAKALAAKAGPLAEADFRRSLERVEAISATMLTGGTAELDERIAALRSAHPSWEGSEELRDWATHQLLLTVNPYPEWCPSTAADDLFFDGLGTTADDAGERRFTGLAHTLNQIKEEYALARYLLHLSLKSDQLRPLSEVTHYADTLDFADFGLSSGLLKASIRHSIDLMDKVANFLNRYLDLGIPERRVSFATVWYEKGVIDPKKRIEHPKLAPYLEYQGWLSGIRDVAETLNVFPAPSKEIRHKATHDFVIIENAIRPVVLLHGKAVAADAPELARQLLVMAKGVIVNMVAFVQRREGMANGDSTKTTVPVMFRYAKGISDELSG